jgi:general L-amino acid transport system permease protein
MTAVDVAPEERDVPPVAERSPAEWARRNLFSSAFNSALTVVMGALVLWAAYRLFVFVFVSAEWEIVQRNLTLFMVGRFPRDELWRMWASLGILAFTIGMVGGMIATTEREVALQTGRIVPEGGLLGLVRRFWPAILLVVVLLGFTRTVTPVVMTVVVAVVGTIGYRLGRAAPHSVRRRWWLILSSGLVASVAVLVAAGGVGWNDWTGLHLNLFVTFAGIALAFPLGLLLALGRRSSLPAVRAVCVGFIELFRGVPLITLLLMAQLALGFFLPSYVDPPGLVIRALIVIVIFEGAYIAEIVRGGLQALPSGQIEAAQALGLSPFTIMRRITLPQALRSVIPAMVGQFISLFQDTSLLSAITLLEVLAVSQLVTSQQDFVGQGLQSVTLPFVAFIFWAVSYSMSRESRRLETRLGIGTR